MGLLYKNGWNKKGLTKIQQSYFQGIFYEYVSSVRHYPETRWFLMELIIEQTDVGKQIFFQRS